VLLCDYSLTVSLQRSRFYGWWYCCIAAGFVLLTAQRYIAGERGWQNWVRLLIAAGFGVLGWLTLRSSRRLS
jgi:hypothetical protein